MSTAQIESEKLGRSFFGISIPHRVSVDFAVVSAIR